MYSASSSRTDSESVSFQRLSSQASTPGNFCTKVCRLRPDFDLYLKLTVFLPVPVRSTSRALAGSFFHGTALSKS